MAFVERQLTLIFTLGAGQTFPASNGQAASNQLTLTNVRAKVRIEKNTGSSTSHATATVYGLTLEHMASLAVLNAAWMVLKHNELEILANDVTNPESTPTSVFTGQITLGEIDLSDEPESALVVTASAGLWYSIAPAQGKSYAGATPVKTIMTDIAGLMNLTPDFSGMMLEPSATLSDTHLSGSLMTQAQEVCDAKFLNLVVDGKTLYVYDRRSFVPVGVGGSIPVVSAATGMLSYPSISEMGIAVRTLFSPFLNMAQRVKIESTLPYATNNWGIYSLVHELESQVPDGKWETSFNCSWADNSTAPA
jgi:hypothetical protein